MVQVDDKYLPEVAVRVFTIKEQIGESQKIIYRNLLDLADPQFAGNNQSKVSAEFNIGELQRKIDVLTEELDKLQ